MRCCRLLLLLMPIAWAAEYRAGVARIDITPPVGHLMGGYEARKHGSTGLHDPLYATVLVIESGDNSLALVTCDLRSFVSTRVGELARQKFGIRNTLIDVSHTHSGPLTWELRSPWYAGAEDKMVEAVGKAKAAEFPATLEMAAGRIYLGHNRRKIVDGKGVMWWRNAEKLPSHPLDPTVNALQVKDDQGKTRAVLVNYACHPSVLGPDNYDYSADYPGAMKRYIESQIPGSTALFVQGGAGDINPLFEARSGKEDDDFKVVRAMGELAGGEVLRANRTVKPLAPVTEPFRWKSEVLTFHDRWEKDKTLDVGITTILLDPEIAIATVPGEPMHKLQKMWKEQADVPVPLFYGYTFSSGGTWAGYIPDLRSAAYGGYGADVTTSIEVGAGEKIMLRHLENLYGLRGMWRDKPGRP